MSAESSQVKAERRNRPGDGARRRAARTAALQRLWIDTLEPRTLMAALPATVFNTTPAQNAVLPNYETNGASNVSAGGTVSDDSSPSIAIDPLDPLKMVSTWTRNQPNAAPGQTEFVQYGISTDGGKIWTNEGRVSGFLFDPTTSGTSLKQFAQQTDASVEFDRNGSFYILFSEHNAGNAIGALRLMKYDFKGNAPTASGTFANNGPTTVYEWVNADQAISPTLAVDSSLATFTDTNANGTAESQNDTYTNNIYVSWETSDAGPPNDPSFNPNAIAVMASSNGGISFSGEQYLNTSGTQGNEREATPQLSISQGSAARPAGTNGPNDPGSPGVSPGQVTGVWDDSGTQSTVGRDQIVSNSISNGAFSQTFPAPTNSPTFVGISSGIVFTQGGPVTPQTTDVPINVNISDPRFTTLSNLTVNMIIGNGANIGALSIQLVPPVGSGLQPITLVANAVNAAGAATNQGLSGQGLGFLNFNNIGTTFDDNAPRNIVNGAQPYVGHFKPEFGSLDSLYGGATPAQLNGTWNLHFTNYAANNTAVLEGDGLNFTSGFTPNANQTVIAQTTIRAAQAGALTGQVDSQGITPQPVIASDNSLGAFSPDEGRLYVAYVGRPNLNGVPATNTNIYLAVSDDGGLTWTDPTLPAQSSNQGTINFGTIVNDDAAQLDGFSEGANPSSTADTATVTTNPNLLNSDANFNSNGRTQFQPSIAVDPVTGTLGLSWYDSRNDPANARVATYTSTSIDGGQTFSTNVYANDSLIATDAITGNTVNLGPIPANESAPSSLAVDPVNAGYGSHQGLAMYDGQLHPVWADNQNGGTDNKQTTSIYTNTGYFSTGPRVISATSGPIGQPGDTLNTDTQSDGTPIASTFLVTFDRPIDPSTFTSADATVMYRDTTLNNVSGGPVPILSVVPVASSENQFGATQFLVNFADGNGVGTYALEINSNDIRDRIRTVTTATVAVGAPQTVTASTSGQGVVPATVPTGGSATFVSVPVAALPSGEVFKNVSVSVKLTAAQDNFVALTLIAPDGTSIPLTRFNEVFGSGGFNGTTFTSSDPTAIPLNQGSSTNNFASPPNYLPASALTKLDGGTIGANASWTLEIRYNASSGAAATLSDFSVTYQPATISQVVNSGNSLDQNNKAYLNTLSIPGVPSNLGDVTDFFATPKPINPLSNPVLDQYGVNVQPNPLPSSTPFKGPYDPTTLPLILPGPHVISTDVAGQPAAPGNLVVNSTVSSIDVTFDRDINPATFTPATVLRVIGPAGQIQGPFTVTKISTRTFRVGFPTQTLSGTYTITLASNIADVNGNQLDTNQNAGVDLLRGAASGASNTVSYSAPSTYKPTPTSAPVANVPLPLTDGKTSVSTLTVPDNFIASNLAVLLYITEPNDPDLQISLVSPNGTSVVLVPSGTGKANGHANFGTSTSSTVFADPGNPNYNVTTPIGNGAPPFVGAYIPAQPLSAFNGVQANGTWKLVITDSSGTGKDAAGTLNSWSLQFQKSVPISDLGEQVADQANVSFRIFTTDPTNPQSSNTWTAVGPAPLVNSGSAAGSTPGFAGQVSALAVDPSDPSGNTVYATGASGGVWKTTNFLTTDAQGPTWVPLTDFGPNSGINIGSIAVFPRNNDPRQSIIIAGTGDPSSSDPGHAGGPTSNGVGFIISKDGGASWALLDSTNNSIAYSQRDHLFAQLGASGVGTSVVKVVVDPHLSPSGQVIIYAALKGVNGGLWKSIDTGQTWTELKAGNATDVVLDLASATVNTQNSTGNVNTIYAAFPGSGVFISPNGGFTLNMMAGGNTNPLFDDVVSNVIGVPVTNGANAPVGNGSGRIYLAKPALVPSSNPNADVENTLYERWLYAAVFQGSGLVGVYLTKDNGATWTELQINGLPSNFFPKLAVPTNNNTGTAYNVAGDPIYQHGDYESAFAIDPTNPNITYIGGTVNGNYSGFIRVDATAVADSHALVPTSNNKNDGGLSRYNSTGDVSIVNKTYSLPFFDGTTNSFAFNQSPYLNLTLDPNNPFASNTTIETYNVASFTNDGSGVLWTPIDGMLSASASSYVPSSNIHSIVTFVDPLTGQTRLLVGDDQGVFSGELTSNGELTTNIGGTALPAYSRNGNLQLAQVNYGAAQPSVTLSNGSTAPASLFYGNSYNLGEYGTDPTILSDGNIAGQGSTDGATLGIYSASSADQSGVGVSVDQQGANVVYRFLDPAYGGNNSDFFQISTDGGQTWTSRTTGLVQVPNDPQWPGQTPRYGGSVNATTGATEPGFGAIPFGNFAVNPLNSAQVIISSNVGRIFQTTDSGTSGFLSIGEPGQLDGTYAPALAFGAPATGSSGNLNSFLYAGTVSGNIFVTTNDGTWTNISSGLDGSPVVKIVPDPNRGTKDAYAVTQQGVYYTGDSTASTVTWTNITGNLFALTGVPYGITNANAVSAPVNTAETLLSYLTSMVADWRYVIPNAVVTGVTPTPGAPTTHPVLYVSGDGGVFRSLDNGATWSQFPSVAVDNSTVDGGYLPVVQVTDLDTSLGKIDPTTGLPVTTAGDPDALLASTFGRGQFSIRLSPLVLPGTVAFAKASISGTDTSGNPLIKTATPTISGYSEQSAYGNVVTVTIYDSNNPSVVIGSGQTDASGHFSITLNSTAFIANGPQSLLIQATDASGAKGNTTYVPFTLQAKITNPNAPPAAPTLGLISGSDSSNGLNITNDASPFVGGATDPGISVQVYIVSINGIPSGQVYPAVVTDANGIYKVQLTNLPDGTYVIQADATNPSNNLVSKSPNFTFQVLTSGPKNAPTLYLEDANQNPVASRSVTTSSRVPVFVGLTAPFANVRIYASNNGVPIPPQLNSTRADSTGRFTISLPTNLTDGTITLQVTATDAAGNQAPAPSTPLTLSVVTAPSDFNGAGKTLPALFQRNANGTTSFIIKGVTSSLGTIFTGGSSTLDVPLQGDVNGDGKSDEILYRPSTGTFTIALTGGGSTTYTPLANPPAGDLPVVGNFDGLGKAEVGVYNPTNGQWTITASNGLTQTFTLNNPNVFTPQSGDIPVPGNYDGSGVDELAVYRPSTGQFFIKVGGTPASGVDNIRVVANLDPTHNPNDVPVPGNYDGTSGIQITEAAVFNPTTDNWYIQGHNGQPVQFGDPTHNDIPAPGDYDNVGHTEFAVYQPSSGAFIVAGPSGVVSLGTAGDVPLVSPLVYRQLPAGAPTVALYNALLPGGTSTAARHPIFGGVASAGATVDLINASGAVVNATVANGAGQYVVGDPTTLNNGTYSYIVRAVSLVGGIGPATPVQTITVTTVNGDYAGLGATQPALFLRGPNKSLTFYVRNDGPLNGLPFYTGAGDIPVLGDFLGNGTEQVAIFTPGTGNWIIAQPSTGYKPQVLLKNFGSGGNFIPAPASYFGGGVDEAAVYQTNTGQWYVQGLTSAVPPITAFRASDIPVPANYNNTGKAELALYRSSTQTWYISTSAGTGAFKIPNFAGAATDIPVPGTYFATAANGSATEAVWRPSTGQYVIYNNLTGKTQIDQFAVGDIPAPGNYDGIGHDEAAVFRPSTGQFFVMGPNDAAPRALFPASQPFGGPGFLPVEAPYYYRVVPVTPSVVKKAITAQSLDMGASAVSLAAPATSKATTVASASTIAAATPKTRPLQAVAPKTSVMKPLSMLKSRLIVRQG